MNCPPCSRLRSASETAWSSLQSTRASQPRPSRRYVDKLGLTFTVPMDGQQEAADRYNIHGLPTTYFIDADGVIRSVWVGEMNSIILAEQIAAIVP